MIIKWQTAFELSSKIHISKKIISPVKFKKLEFFNPYQLISY